MTVYVFGSNACSELGTGTDQKSTHVPTRLIFFDDKKLRKLACGTMHTLVITDDGKLWSWGCNDEWALGRSGDESVPGEVEIPGIPMSIGCGDSISVCITDNNKVYMWGTFRSSKGVHGLGINTKVQKKPKHIHTRMTGFKFVDVSCGANFACLLAKNQSVWTCGSNEFFELGRRTSERNKDSSLFPLPIFSALVKKKNHKFVAVRCGTSHAGALNTDGEVIMWGCNIYGQLGIGHSEDSKDKTKLDLEKIVDIAGGLHHTLFLDSNNNLYGCGRNNMGQLGDMEGDMFEEPVKLNIKDVCRIRSSGNFSIVQVQNTLYSFGVSYEGATGFDTMELKTPTAIPFDFGPIVDFQVGGDFTVVVTE